MLCSAISVAQNVHKSNFYLGWGYNRDWFSESTIHLENSKPQLIDGKNYTYDFKVYNVKAHDRPQFNRIHDIANITIPQFSVRGGYYFNNKSDCGIELNYDHAKYVVTDNQKVRASGQVNGLYFDQDTILDPINFLHFEHTDGANFFMIAFIKRFNLLNTKNDKNHLGICIKPGFGFVYPRTDVTIFGSRLNNKWKIAGIDAGLEISLRAELFRHLFFEFSGKAVYANYINALVQGKGFGKASHHFYAFENILVCGYQF